MGKYFYKVIFTKCGVSCRQMGTLGQRIAIIRCYPKTSPKWGNLLQSIIRTTLPKNGKEENLAQFFIEQFSFWDGFWVTDTAKLSLPS